MIGTAVTATTFSQPGCTGTGVPTDFNLNVCLAVGVKVQLISAMPVPNTVSPPSGNSPAADCFAGSETVRLESGEDRQISQIMAGDRVLATDAAGKLYFSEVVFVPHSANKVTAVFIHITTTSGRDIKMTKSHVLPAGACGSSSPLPLRYASQVSVNDCVMTVTGEESVSTVGTIVAEGLQTIVTREEFIVVNGIVSSPFAHNHIAANLFYHMHRFLYDAAPQLLLSPLLRSVNEVSSHAWCTSPPSIP